MSEIINGIPCERDESGKVTKFVIDRKKWRRGRAAAEASYLLSSQGDMCCLGFYSRACGVEPDWILSQCYVSGLLNDYPELPEQLRWLAKHDACGWGSSDAERAITHLNDNAFRSDEEIEKGVQEYFAEKGIEVVFTDGEA